MFKRILTILLSIVSVLSCALLFSCGSCGGEELPANLSTYQELLDKYKPSDADLEKALSDFGNDAYAIYKRAYYQLLLCDQYSLVGTGGTETLGVAVEINNLKKRDGMHFYMQTDSHGSSGLFSGVTDSNIQSYFDIQNGYVKTQNNLKNDGYNGMEQTLDDYLSRWGVLQYALCGYVIDETTVQSAEIRQGETTFLVLTLDPVLASVNLVKQMRMTSGTAGDYGNGEIVYTVEIDDSFVIRSVNMKERYKAMGFSCNSDITDVYSYPEDASFSPMTEDERYTYSGNGTQDPVAPVVYDASYLFTSLARLGAGADATVTLCYGETEQEFQVSFTVEPIAARVTTEVCGKPVCLDLRAEGDSYRLFITADELTVQADVRSLTEVLSDYAELFGIGGDLGGSLGEMLSGLEVGALKALATLTGEKTADGIVYRIALSAFVADTDGEISVVIGENGEISSLSLTDLSVNGTPIVVKVDRFASVSELLPLDTANAVDAVALLKRLEPFVLEKAFSFRTELFGTEVAINADFSGETPIVRADLSSEDLPSPVSVWLSDCVYLTMDDFAVSVEYEDIASIAALFGISIELPTIPENFDLQTLLNDLSVSNEGSVISIKWADYVLSVDTNSLEVSVPTLDLRIFEWTAGADATLPALDWQKLNDVLPVVDALFDYFRYENFDIDARVCLEGYEITVDGRLSVADGFVLDGTVGAFGETVSVWYGDNRLCLGWNQIRAVVRLDAVTELLPSIPSLPELDFTAIESVLFEENKIFVVIEGVEIGLALENEKLILSVAQTATVALTKGAFDSIEEPTDTIDITEAIVGFNAEKFSSLVQTDVISFAFAYGEYCADVTVTLEPFSVCAQTTIEGIPIVICYRDGLIEVVAEDYAVSLTVEDIVALLADFDISIDEISNIDVDVETLLNSVRLISAEGTEITVEVMGITVKLDVATFEVTVADVLTVTDIAAEARVERPEREYVYIGKSLSVIAPAFEIMTDGGLSLNGSVTIDGAEIGIEAEVSYADGIAACGTLTVYDYSIAFTYGNGTLYCSIAEIKASVDGATILEWLDLGEIAIDRSMIGALSAGEDWFGIELAEIPVVVKKTASGLKLSAEGLCSFDITAGCGAIVLPTGYADITEAIVGFNAEKLSSLVETNVISFACAYGEYCADVTVTLEPFSVCAQTTIEEIPIVICYRDGLIEVVAEDYAVSLTVEDIVALLADFDFSIDEISNIEVDIEEVLNSVRLISSEGTEITVEVMGITVKLDVATLELMVANVLTVTDIAAEARAERPEREYVYIGKSLSVIAPAFEIMTDGGLSLNGSVTIDGVEIGIEAEVSYADGIAACGTLTAYDYSIAFTYGNGTLYCSIAEIKASVDGATILEWLDLGEIAIDRSMIGALSAGEDWFGIELAEIPVVVKKTVSGLKLSVEGLCSFDITAGCGAIVLPTGYADITEAIIGCDFETLSDIAEKERIAITATAMGYTAEIAVDLRTFSVKATTEIEGIALECYYENGVLSVRTGELALYLTKEEIRSLIGEWTEIDLDGFTRISVESVLSLIRNVTADGACLSFELDGTSISIDTQTLTITVAEIAEIQINGAGNEITIPVFESQSAAKLSPMIQTALALWQSGKLNIDGTLTVDGVSLNLRNWNLAFGADGIRSASGAVEAFGQTLNVIYASKRFYFNLAQMRVSAGLAYVKVLLENAGISLDSFEVVPSELLSKLSGLEIEDNRFKIEYDGLAVRATFGKESVSLTVGEFGTITIAIGNFTEATSPIGYQDGGIFLMQFNVALLRSLTEEDVLSATVKIGDIRGKLSVSLSDFCVKFELGEDGVSLWYENGRLYFAGGELALSAEIVEWLTVLGLDSALDIDFGELIEQIKVYFEGNVLCVSYRGTIVKVNPSTFAISVPSAKIIVWGYSSVEQWEIPALDWKALDLDSVFSFTFAYGEYCADVTVTLEPFSVCAQTTIEEIPIVICYRDGLIEVVAEDYAVSLTVEDIVALLADFDISIDEISNIDVDVETLLNSVRLISAEGTEITVEVMGITVKLDVATLELTVTNVLTVTDIAAEARVERPEREYVYIGKSLSVIAPAFEIMTDGSLSLNGSVTVNGMEMGIEAEVSYADGIAACGTLTVYDYSIAFTYGNGTLYCSIAEIKASVDGATILEWLDLGEIAIDRSMIGALSAGEDWFGIELAEIPVVVKKTVSGLKLSAEGLCSFDITAGCGAIILPTGYADITEAIVGCDFETLSDIAEKERIAITATAMGYTAEIAVDLRTFSVKATTEIEGIALECYYENGVLSVRSGELALYLTKEEIRSLIGEWTEIDLDGFTRISVESVLSLIRNVTADGACLSFELDGTSISIDTQTLTITVAEIAEIQINGAGNEITIPVFESQSAAKLSPMIQTALALWQSGKLNIDGTLTVDGVSLNLRNWNLAFGADGIRSASGAVEAFGQTLNVIYASERFYFNLAQMRVSAGLAYVKVLLENAGISLDSFEVVPFELLSKLSGLEIEDNRFKIEYDGLAVTATFGEERVSLTVGEFGTITIAIGNFSEATSPIGYQDGGIFLMQFNVALLRSLTEEDVLSATVKIGDIRGKLSVSLSDFCVKFELGEDGVSLWYENGRLYFAGGELALSAEIVEWLTVLGLDSALDIDFGELIERIEVSFEENILCVSYRGTVIKINPSTFEVSVPSWNLTVENDSPVEKWILPTLDWQNLDYLIPAVNQATTIVENGKVALSGSVTVGDVMITINRLEVFFDENGLSSLNLNASCNGTELTTVYTNGTLYFEGDGWRFSASGESLLIAVQGVLSADLTELPEFDRTSIDPLEAIRSLTVGENEATLTLLLNGEEISVTFGYGTALSLQASAFGGAVSLQTENGEPVVPEAIADCIDLSDVLSGFDYRLLSLLSDEIVATATGTVGGMVLSAEVGIAPSTGFVSVGLEIGGMRLTAAVENGVIFLAAGSAYSQIDLTELIRYVEIFTGETDFLAELKNSLAADGTILSFSVMGIEIAVDAASLSVTVTADGTSVAVNDLRAGSCETLPDGEYRSLNGLTPLISSVYEGYQANRFTANGSLVLGGQSINISDVKVKIDNAASPAYCWADATKAFDEGRLPLTGKISLPTADRTHILDISYVAKTLYVSYTDNGSDFTRLKFSRESLDDILDVILRNQSELTEVLEILGIDLSALSGMEEISLADAVSALRTISVESGALTIGIDGSFVGLNGVHSVTVCLNDDGTIGLALSGADLGGSLTLGYKSDFTVTEPTASYIDASRIADLIDGLIVTVNKESRQFYFEGTMKMQFFTIDVNVKIAAYMRVAANNKLDAYVTWDASRSVGEEITTIFNNPTGLTYMVHTDYLTFGKSSLAYTYDYDKGDYVVMVARMNQWADYYETGRYIKTKHYFYADGDYQYKKAYVADINSGDADVLDIISVFTGLDRSLLEISSDRTTSYAKLLQGYSCSESVHTVKLDVGELAKTDMLGVATFDLTRNEDGYLTDTYVVLPVKFIGLEMLDVTLEATHIVDRTVNAEMDVYFAEAKSKIYGSFLAVA